MNFHRREVNGKNRDIGCACRLPSGEEARVENLSSCLRARRAEIAIGDLHLARIMVQIVILQNHADESFLRIGVRDHEHLGIAQDSGERDHAAKSR